MAGKRAQCRSRADPWPSHRVQTRREAGGEASGIIAQREVLAADHLEAAIFQKILEIALAVVHQVAWNVDAVPVLAKHQELPGRRVGHLHDQPSPGQQKIAGGSQIADGVVQVLDDMEHRYDGAASALDGGLCEVPTNHRDAILVPGGNGGRVRRFEAKHRQSALVQHLEKKAAAAADIHYQPALPGIFDSPHHKIDMIAQDETAVRFFDARGGVGIGLIPIFARIIIGQLFGRWPRLQANEAASLAFHDQEAFVGGVIEAVACAEQRPDTGLAAARAFHSQIACSVSSFSGMRCCSISPLTSRGESFLMRFTLRRFASILGSSDRAARSPFSSASAARIFPVSPG